MKQAFVLKLMMVASSMHYADVSVLMNYIVSQEMLLLLVKVLSYLIFVLPFMLVEGN